MTTPTHRSRRDRAAWWATLTDDALDDETRENQRTERRLVGIALVAGAITAVFLVLRVLVA